MKGAHGARAARQPVAGARRTDPKPWSKYWSDAFIGVNTLFRALRDARGSGEVYPSWLTGASRPGLERVAQDSEHNHSHRTVLRDGREVILRAITETDAPAIQRAFDHLSSESRYSRFLHHKKHLDPAALARGVHPQPGRDFVIVATLPQPGAIDIVGAAQYVRASPSDDSTCEFAITVAEDWRGCGLARELLTALLQRARSDHYVAMVGLVLADNAPMLALAHKLGFSVEPSSDGDTVVQVLRQLRAGPYSPHLFKLSCG